MYPVITRHPKMDLYCYVICLAAVAVARLSNQRKKTRLNPFDLPLARKSPDNQQRSRRRLSSSSYPSLKTSRKEIRQCAREQLDYVRRSALPSGSQAYPPLM